MTENPTCIGIEISGDTCTGWAFPEGQGVTGAVPDVVAAKLGATPLTRIIVAGLSDCAMQPVPAAANPENLSQSGAFHVLPALSQSAPMGVLPATARLRIIGFLAQNKDWDGVALLCDRDLSHWVQISASEIVSFQSFLTGRLARALDVPADAVADLDAVSDTMARPERLATHLRSAEVAGRFGAILGHLVGAEIAAARPYWLGQKLMLINDGTQDFYGPSLGALGVPVSHAESDVMAHAGFAALAD